LGNSSIHMKEQFREEIAAWLKKNVKP